MLTTNLQIIPFMRRMIAASTKRFATMMLIATAAVLAIAQPAKANQDSWSPAANMATGRSKHTATLLANGMVLVAGGFDDQSGSYLATAERYDPVTNTWSPAGGLATARASHTATLLANGKVLIIGGAGSSGPLASCELYDPSTNTWSPAASLATPRVDHAATRLNDGKVLVTGGGNNTDFQLDTTELYDPVTDSWSPMAKMGQPRLGHTATLLGTGEVMITGGSNLCSALTSCVLASAERYNPASNTWTTAASLHGERSKHTATLLSNGKVLVAGGFLNGLYPAIISYEVYDPAADIWSVGSMTSARSYHDAVALPYGKILVVGGVGPQSLVVSSGDVYEPLTDSWSAAASMSTTRIDHTTTALNDGRVLVAGGFPSLATAELYTLVVNVPGSPTNVAAGALDGAATIYWVAPTSDGGSPITRYNVTVSPGGTTVTAGPGDRTALVTGLTDGTTYIFTVTATNAVGDSLPSGRSNPVTPFRTPDPPTGVTATPGNASATVSWVPPAFNGGSIITSYIIVSSPDNVVAYTDGLTTSATVSGLTNGKAYTFTVRATNAAGNSNPSGPSNAVTPQALAIVAMSPTGARADITSVITAKFNRAIDPATLRIVVSPQQQSGTDVKGSITCNSPCTVATFTPTRAFKYATSYGVTVSGSNTSESASKSWTFTTASR